MAASTDNNGGIKEQFLEHAGGLLKSIISIPDNRPKFLEDYIDESTWKKVARIGFDILMVGAGFLLIYTMSRFMSISDPSIMSLMPICAGLALSGFGLKFLMEDLLKEHLRTAAKVMAVLLPLLLVGGTVCMVGAGLHSLMGGYGFNAYFMAGIVMVPLTVVAIKHSASTFKDSNGTFFPRRAQSALAPDSFESQFNRLGHPD